MLLLSSRLKTCFDLNMHALKMYSFEFVSPLPSISNTCFHLIYKFLINVLFQLRSKTHVIILNLQLLACERNSCTFKLEDHVHLFESQSCTASKFFDSLMHIAPKDYNEQPTRPHLLLVDFVIFTCHCLVHLQ